MERLKREINEIAVLAMLEHDVSEKFNQLKTEYGRELVERETKNSGFGCILKQYVSD